MNSLSLYQITSAFPIIMEQEEMTEEEKAKLEQELTMLLQQKSQSVIGYTRNMELTIAAKKEEEKRLAESRKADEKKLENFKKYVKECMERNQITKIETELGTLSIAKRPISIDIIDEELIPEEFIQQKIIRNPDKEAIKSHFKETGEIINGTKVNTDNTSLRIK